MNEKDGLLPLSAAAADRLIAAHDGDVALLYLYMLRRGGLDAEDAAGALCRTAREIGAAAEKLGRMGLTAAAPAERVLPPEPGTPDYRAEDLVRFAEEDPSLRAVFGEAEKVFGRKLSPADMRMLAGLNKHHGLPAEVMFTLLHYCAERARARKEGSVPSPRAVEKEGYDWVSREILTLEQADEYVNFRSRQREQVSLVKAELDIRGRELGKTEREYVERWLGLGFPPKSVAIAYDRALIKTGRLNWPYMDRILRSWHEKKLHTPEEIAAGDPGRRPPSGGAGNGGSVERGELDDIYSKI